MSKKKQSKNQDRTVIEVATQLVDSVTKLLFSEITTGSLFVDEDETPLKLDPIIKKSPQKQQSISLLKMNKSKIKIQMESIDIDEHKKLVRKFMSQNKNFRRKREMRSVEISEKSLKMKEDQSQREQSERNRILEQRRRSISERLEAKKNLLKQIQKQTLESNTTISSIKRKKFLYQQKQQQYYKNFVLPKIQQQKTILESKKSLLKPINITQLLQHEKNYQTLRINSRINRSLTISVIKTKENQYHPPQFVPQAFKKVQEEEEEERLEEEIRKRQVEVNDIRRREFVKKVDQLREIQKEIQRSKEKQRPESPKKQQAKSKAKPQLNRQQMKNVGNDYLRELINNNRKLLQQKKSKNLSQTINLDITAPSSPRNHKSEYQIQIIKQQRIERVHKIRGKKINQIMHDKNLDEHTRNEKLKYQIDKLDGQVQHKLKQGNDVETINESAMIMMNAIQAKMALLGVDIEKQG